MPTSRTAAAGGARSRQPAAKARARRKSGHTGGTRRQKAAPNLAEITSVGVRELRQNLSVYLDLIKQGRALSVTEHGHVVAVLRPVPANASRIDILIAQGLVTPATRSIRDLPPPRKAPPGSRPMSEILEEMRDEERY